VLCQALHAHGDLEMAEDFLNCENGRLEDAAYKWADDHGYTVSTSPGSHGGPTWGEGL